MAVGGNEREKRRPQLRAELCVIFSCCCGSQGAVVAALNMFWPVEVSSPAMDKSTGSWAAVSLVSSTLQLGDCFHWVESLGINSANLVNFS